jgi:hypothetical protein
MAMLILIAIGVALVCAALYALFGKPSSHAGKRRKQQAINVISTGILMFSGDGHKMGLYSQIGCCGYFILWAVALKEPLIGLPSFKLTSKLPEMRGLVNQFLMNG